MMTNTGTSLENNGLHKYITCPFRRWNVRNTGYAPVFVRLPRCCGNSDVEVNDWSGVTRIHTMWENILFAASSGSCFTQISQVAVAGVFLLIFILASAILVKAIRLRFTRRRGGDLPASNMTLFPNDDRNYTSLGLDDSAVEALGTTYSFTAETGEKGGVSAGEVADGADVEAGEARNASLRECSVCLEEFKEGQSCRTLVKCGHSFHQTCIDKWAKRHASCPLCRISLLPDTKVEEEPHTTANGLSHSVPAVTLEEEGAVLR